MNKEEIEAAQRFIDTPITAENLEPAIAVFPKAPQPELIAYGKRHFVNVLNDYIPEVDTETTHQNITDAIAAARREGAAEAYLDCANYMQVTQSTPDWAYLEFRKRAELAKKEH